MDEEIKKAEYPTDSIDVTFEIFDIYRNSTIFVDDWLRFMAFSYGYMELTPLGV